MRLKAGVKIAGAQWQVWWAALIAEEEYRKLGLSEVVITSLLDGKHKHQSKHYTGLGLDTRIWHIAKESVMLLARNLSKRLGKDYDVVVESDHIHIEYDPK